MVVGWFFGFVTTTLSRGSTNHHLKTLTTQGTLPVIEKDFLKKKCVELGIDLNEKP
jgi:hypothetical protein